MFLHLELCKTEFAVFQLVLINFHIQPAKVGMKNHTVESEVGK
jgi:hypothetical protein